MIVTAAEQKLRIVTQNDHAHLASELLSLWRSDGLPDHPRRRQLLFAVREHDNGWREADAAPSCRSDGKPHDFLSIPGERRREIWSRGVKRFRDREPYATLLILSHALRLHRGHATDPDWNGVLDDWRRLEEELRDGAGVSSEEFERDSRWLALCDTLSLAVCCRWREPVESHGVRARMLGDSLGLEPFPLAGATTLRVPCRSIPDRPYRGDADLGTELASARWRELTVRIAPLAASS